MMFNYNFKELIVNYIKVILSAFYANILVINERYKN